MAQADFPVITSRVPKELSKEIDELCAQFDVSRSMLVRFLLLELTENIQLIEWMRQRAKDRQAQIDEMGDLTQGL
jgi:Arc/MetJ-type ribon-helix-helix transcriptional regulator